MGDITMDDESRIRESNIRFHARNRPDEDNNRDREVSGIP